MKHKTKNIETISQTKKEAHRYMSYAIVRNEKLTRAEVNGKRIRGRIEQFLLNKYRVEISTLYLIFR